MRNRTECHRPGGVTRGDFRVREQGGKWLVLIGKNKHLFPPMRPTSGTRLLRKIHDDRKAPK